jgi:hypothetical protein
MEQLSSLIDRYRGTGTLVAGVITVGAIGYLIRRAGQRRRPTDLGGKVSELAREVVGDDPLEAGQEFLRKQIVPELKPVLLAILDEVENVVADGFKRAEKAIKQM